MKIIIVLLSFSFIINFTNMVYANQPEAPGKQTACLISDAMLNQKFVPDDSKVYVEHSLDLNLQIPELEINEKSLTLNDGGAVIGGPLYMTEIRGLMIGVYTVDETTSGPVEVVKIRVTRKNPDRGQIRRYDCEIHVQK